MTDKPLHEFQNTYSKYAALFAGNRRYARFTEQMTENILAYLEKAGFFPARVLDIACGCGTAAKLMCDRGIKVVGIDNSAEMLEIARRQLEGVEPPVELYRQDMRQLCLAGQQPFDLVTCMYDSLNYLLSKKELGGLFRKVRDLLKPNGYFMFDMATVYGLSVVYNIPLSLLSGDEYTEYHETRFHFSNMISVKHITCLQNNGGSGESFSERHVERAYSEDEIEEELEKAGFRIEAALGERFSKPKNDDPRKVYICRPLN